MTLSHFIQTLLFLFFLSAPLPLCFRFLFASDPRAARSIYGAAFVTAISLWLIVQGFVSLFLLSIHQLKPGAFWIAELVIFLFGSWSLFFHRGVDHGFFNDFSGCLQRLLPGEKFVLGFISVLAGILLWRITTTPVTEYDSLAYHLPFMANWYQSGSFHILGQFSDQVGRYPFTWEVLSTSFLIPFQEDFMVAFPNWVVWILFGLGIYALGRELGANRFFALVTASFGMAMPIAINQVNTLQVDLALAAFFFIGLYMVLLFQRTRKLHFLYLFLLQVGFLSGIKTSGLVYGVFLALIALVLEVYQRRSKPVPRIDPGSVLFGVLGISGFLFLGGFWYLKNLVETQNPLGLISLRLGNWILFPGPVDASGIYQTTLANLFDFTNFRHWKILLGRIWHQLNISFLGIGILLVITIFSFCQRKTAGEKRIIAALFALVVVTAGFYWITPYSGDNGANQWQITRWIGYQFRFAFPFLGLVAVLSSLNSFHLRFLKPFLLLLLSGSVLSVLFPGERVYFIIIAFGASLYFWQVHRWRELAGRVKWAIFIFLTVFLFGWICIAREKRALQRTIVYDGLQEFLEMNIPPQEPVGYLLSHRSYPLYGKKLDRKIKYAESKTESEDQWIEDLCANNIRFVAVGPLRKEWKTRTEIQWLENSHGSFIKVYGKDLHQQTVIYQLAD